MTEEALRMTKEATRMTEGFLMAKEALKEDAH